MAVTAIGWRAHAALAASGGKAAVVAALSASTYATAAGEVIWIGPPGGALHPRSVVVSDGAPVSVGVVFALDVDGMAAWRPPPLPGPLGDVGEAARLLRDGLSALGPPRGLACLLTTPEGGDARGGDTDNVVTARARSHARALARACIEDSPGAAIEAARPLLGLGPGLTPSGDDYVGGALFARHLLPTRDTPGWDAAVSRIRAEGETRTHPISAILLDDLARGEGWAPLHALAHALRDAGDDRARHAARELTGLGHTSGWDILAGFLAVLCSLPTDRHGPAIVP